MAAAHEYSCMIWLHVPIDYQNVLIVNFTRGQKVVWAGLLLSADRPEISLKLYYLNKFQVISIDLLKSIVCFNDRCDRFYLGLSLLQSGWPHSGLD